MRWLRANMLKEYKTKGFIDYLKDNTDWNDLDTKNEHVFKQVFKQMFELYINENKNGNINNNINKEEKFDFKKSLIDYGFQENLVDDWLKVRKTKRATNTETAFNRFIKQVELVARDKNEILEICISRSWQGFEADWLNKLNNNGTSGDSGNIKKSVNKLWDRPED